MLRLCRASLTLSLKAIFEETLNDGVFPDERKKSNVQPIYKKDLKVSLKKLLSHKSAPNIC